MPEIHRKVCRKCHEEKPLADFYKHKRDGYEAQCKKCMNKANAEYRKKNREKVLAKKKEWYQKKKEWFAKEYAEHAEEIKQKRRKEREEHPEKNRLAAKKWYKKNREKVRAYAKMRRQTFPEALAAYCAVRKAIVAKRLTRLPCEVCGREPAEAHHEDYDKPLDVVWLCRSCHLRYHARLNKERADEN